MTTNRFFSSQRRLPWQLEMAAGACVALLMASPASGQWEKVGGLANPDNPICAGSGGDCYPQSIAVGPNANGSTVGDPWLLGSSANSDGDYDIYEWQDSAWVKQPGAATQIAISPNGYPWVVTRLGTIYYWNGAGFAEFPSGCATSIGVGPNAFGSTYGDPWVIGCDGGYGTNGSVYQLQGSNWVKQPGSAAQIAVSPEGVPWVVTAAGSVYFWNGSAFSSVGTGCATSIAVGPTTAPGATPFGDVWITGCPPAATSGGYHIYQLSYSSSAFSWTKVAGVATQISVSPDLGIPWVVRATGHIYYRN